MRYTIVICLLASYMVIVKPASSQELLNENGAVDAVNFFFHSADQYDYTLEQRLLLRELDEEWNFHIANALVPYNPELMRAATDFRKQAAPEFLARIRAVSPDRYREGIQSINQTYAVFRLSRSGERNDPSFLTADALADLLELSDTQLDRLHQLAAEAEEAIDALSVEHRDSRVELRKEKYDEILNAMNRGQRREFSTLVGPPTWYANDVTAPPENARILESNGVTQDVESSRRATQPRDRFIVDFLYYSILQSDQVRREVELVEEQDKRLDDYINQRLRYVTHTNETHTARLEQLLSEEAEPPTDLSDILLDHQIVRLHQIELQVRLGHPQTFGALSTVMRDRLDLSVNQRHAIEEVVAEFDEKLASLSSKQQLDLRNINDQFRSRMLDELNMSQRDQYERLIGFPR